MGSQLKFLADMGISNKCAEWMRKKGFDTTHLVDQGFYRLADEEIYRKAKIEGRIILTVDLDFSDIAAASKMKLPSVITFRLTNKNWENISFHLSLVLERYSNDLIEGAIISVGDKKIRLRKLPIS